MIDAINKRLDAWANITRLGDKNLPPHYLTGEFYLYTGRPDLYEHKPPVGFAKVNRALNFQEIRDIHNTLLNLVGHVSTAAEPKKVNKLLTDIPEHHARQISIKAAAAGLSWVAYVREMIKKEIGNACG